jgi:hypothetical protein
MLGDALDARLALLLVFGIADDVLGGQRTGGGGAGEGVLRREGGGRGREREKRVSGRVKEGNLPGPAPFPSPLCLSFSDDSCLRVLLRIDLQVLQWVSERVALLQMGGAGGIGVVFNGASEGGLGAAGHHQQAAQQQQGRATEAHGEGEEQGGVEGGGREGERDQ